MVMSHGPSSRNLFPPPTMRKKRRGLRGCWRGWQVLLSSCPFLVVIRSLLLISPPRPEQRCRLLAPLFLAATPTPPIFPKGVRALQKHPQPIRIDSIIVTFLRKRKQNKGNILEINDRRLLFGEAGGRLGEHRVMEGKKVISEVSGGKPGSRS